MSELMSWKDVHIHRPKQRISRTQKNYHSNDLRCWAVQQHLLLYFGLVLLHFYTGSYYLGSGRWLCRDPWGWRHGGKLSSQSIFLSDPSPPWEEDKFLFLSQVWSPCLGVPPAPAAHIPWNQTPSSSCINHYEQGCSGVSSSWQHMVEWLPSPLHASVFP